MKNYLLRSAFKGLMSVLFLLISSSSFAISFDEPRKVIIPQYANAVYRDLTVLDKIYFDIEKNSNRIFLLELGKRPSYFWDKNKRFYFYQNLLFKLDPGNITYNDSTENKNVLTISRMDLDEGTFASEHIFLNEGSTIRINNSLSTLLVNYKGDFPAYLHFGNESHTYTIYSLLFRYIKGGLGSYDIAHKVDNLYLRDLTFGTVKVPSNRAMIHYTDGKYKAQGTATDFELYTPKPFNRTTNPPTVKSHAKSYYGRWEIYEDSVLSSSDPCGTLPGDRCYRRSCTVSSSGNLEEPGGNTRGASCVDTNYDTATSLFYCNNPFNSSQSGVYDPEVGCYDYQEKDLVAASLSNNNQAYYEFKIEELYSINESGTATLLSQTPKLSTNINALSGYNSLTDSWTLKTNKRSFLINGTNYSNISPKGLIDAFDTNPCFTLCNGQLCPSNIVYMRDRTRRDLKGGDASATNYWPASEGHKQHLVFLTYTLGFCPKRAGNNSFADYEDNIGDQSSLIDGLVIKKSGANVVAPSDASGSWVTSKVCMRRYIKCNSINENKYDRSYQLLSTDN